jgi:hypothetical protein
MVKYFHFHSTTGDIRNVVEPLESTQCIFVRDGRQCRKRCQIGISYCWIHLRSVMHLRIKDTGGDMGLGLFADNGDPTSEAIVFRSGDNVIEYEGEPMNDAERLERYGGHTAPYMVAFNENTLYDCAISRCVGGLINHAPHSTANCAFSTNNVNNRVRVKVQPGKNVRNGQQIRVSYNSEVPGRRYRMNEPGVSTYTSTRRNHPPPN